MSKNTFLSLFSGGGLADLGAIAAGCELVGAVEVDPDVCAVYADNHGPHILTARVEDVCYRQFAGVDVAWASPSCKNASVANAGAGETEGDLSAADAVCRMLREARPKGFCLENVRGYAKSCAFTLICETLTELGYWFTYDIENAANFGGTTLCPFHNADYAEQYLVKEIAPDIVKSAAMMRPDDQARILAWNAGVALARLTKQDIAEDVQWPELANCLRSKANLATTGLVVDLLTNEDMSRFALMDDTAANIASLLNRCLEDPSNLGKWSTTSMEIRRITVLKILQCILATPSTLQSIISNDRSRKDGDLATNGETCPLCKTSSVPQTRQRLILRACLDGVPAPLPMPTRWVGWYEAIEDLLPGLPPSAFAKWQIRRLPAELTDFLASTVTADGTTPPREREDPAFTVQATANKQIPKAFLANSAFPESNGRKHCGPDEPAFTVDTGSDSRLRAFLVDCQNGGTPDASGQRGLTNRQAPEPAHTITGTQSRRTVRAFLVSEQYDAPNDNSERSPQVRIETEPSFTVKAGSNQKARAWLEAGRVVSLTPRALARFQAVPDSYRLPSRTKLACGVIGNGVAVHVATAAIRSVLEGSR